jgi:poly [ADP-ribose] polymerase 2/3/4
MKMMNSQLKEIGYDSKKMPLGKIARSSIVKGYEALKEVLE